MQSTVTAMFEGRSSTACIAIGVSCICRQGIRVPIIRAWWTPCWHWLPLNSGKETLPAGKGTKCTENKLIQKPDYICLDRAHTISEFDMTMF